MKKRDTVKLLLVFSLCIVVLPVLYIFYGPVKLPICIMYNCIGYIIPWRTVLLLGHDSWFLPLVFPEWSLVKKKNNSGSNMMFWINISNNFFPVMLRMKCHHALAVLQYVFGYTWTQPLLCHRSTWMLWVWFHRLDVLRKLVFHCW